MVTVDKKRLRDRLWVYNFLTSIRHGCKNKSYFAVVPHGNFMSFEASIERESHFSITFSPTTVLLFLCLYFTFYVSTV